MLLLLQPFFLISGLSSIVIGTFGTLYQIRIKRFLGLASLSQLGLMLLGISCYSINGIIGSLLHIFIYSIVTSLFF